MEEKVDSGKQFAQVRQKTGGYWKGKAIMVQNQQTHTATTMLPSRYVKTGSSQTVLFFD